MNERMNFLKISGIDSVFPDINLLAKIVSVQQKTIKNEKGESAYYFGILGDETGTIPFTAWVFPSTLQVGDVIEVTHASSREYNGAIRLNLDSRSQVVLKPGTDVDVKRSYPEKKIRDLSLKDPFVTVSGKISNVIQRDKEKDGENLKIWYADLEDDSAVIRITSFRHELKNGDTLKIVGAKVSEYNGKLRLTMSENTHAENIELNFTFGMRLSNIADIHAPISGVTLACIVVNLGNKSGVIKRCKTCNKKVDEDVCEEHPNDGVYKDLFAYFTAEDGTGYVHCTSGRSALENVLELTSAHLEDQSVTNSKVFTRLNESLLGKAMIISGDFVNNNGNMTFRARSIRHMLEDDLKTIRAFEDEDIR